MIPRSYVVPSLLMVVAIGLLTAGIGLLIAWPVGLIFGGISLFLMGCALLPAGKTTNAPADRGRRVKSE